MATKDWFGKQLADAQESFDFRLEKILIEVGESIAFFMKEEKLSRSQMADRLGVSRAYVTKILNGQPNLTIKTLLKLSDVLNEDLGNLFRNWQQLCVVHTLRQDRISNELFRNFQNQPTRMESWEFRTNCSGEVYACNTAA